MKQLLIGLILFLGLSATTGCAEKSDAQIEAETQQAQLRQAELEVQSAAMYAVSDAQAQQAEVALAAIEAQSQAMNSQAETLAAQADAMAVQAQAQQAQVELMAEAMREQAQTQRMETFAQVVMVSVVCMTVLTMVIIAVVALISREQPLAQQPPVMIEGRQSPLLENGIGRQAWAYQPGPVERFKILTETSDHE